jgi:hypothetical protein
VPIKPTGVCPFLICWKIISIAQIVQVAHTGIERIFVSARQLHLFVQPRLLTGVKSNTFSNEKQASRLTFWLDCNRRQKECLAE